jgi:NAD(P)-dependent dehydrogenase (short-subunit alcohol dehydrogenase family)
MVVWADTAEECYRRLVDLVNRAETFLEARRAGRPAFGPARGGPLPEARRRDLAEELLPVLRGALGPEERVILHWDDSPRVLEALAGDSFRELSQRGVTTSEHILRAGRRPLWLEIDPEASAPQRADAVRAALEASRSEYVDYHRRHAAPDAEPIGDWAKVVLVPGLGMVTAFKDKPSAVTANICYSAVIDTLENAEALGGFRFLAEQEVFFFEHWPLERRKVEEAIREERRSLLLPRHVALILGGASGIGAAAAWRFAEEGAHVVVGDLDGPGAMSVASEICKRYPRRASGLAVDVRDESAIVAAVRQSVLEFGGLDSLFYTPGLAPRFAPLAETGREDLQSQLEVHYLGAMLAIREAAAVMRRQGLGGSILCSVSKAALAPGRNATAYGGSKAALQHALRVAALELGADGIRVNSINADQVETPLFLRFARARAKSLGVPLEQQLETYRQRNALGVSLIPPGAVADLAVLLASERFRFTTGDIITIDGGLSDAFPR